MARQASRTTGGSTPARTRAEKVADALREEILRGKLAPGEALREIHLAKRLRVSRIPLREGLRILEGEGLATHRAHHGAVVRPLSQAEALDLLEVLAMAESAAFRHAAAALGKEELDAAEELLGRLRKERDSLAWMQLRDELVASLLAPMQRPVFQAIVTTHHRLSARYLFALLGDSALRKELEGAYEKALRSLRRKEGDKAGRALEAGSQAIAADIKRRKLFGDAGEPTAKPAAKARGTAKKRAAKAARPRRRA